MRKAVSRWQPEEFKFIGTTFKKLAIVFRPGVNEWCSIPKDENKKR